MYSFDTPMQNIINTNIPYAKTTSFKNIISNSFNLIKDKHVFNFLQLVMCFSDQEVELVLNNKLYPNINLLSNVVF